MSGLRRDQTTNSSTMLVACRISLTVPHSEYLRPSTPSLSMYPALDFLESSSNSDNNSSVVLSDRHTVPQFQPNALRGISRINK
jgi:hypothetical protein